MIEFVLVHRTEKLWSLYGFACRSLEPNDVLSANVWIALCYHNTTVNYQYCVFIVLPNLECAIKNTELNPIVPVFCRDEVKNVIYKFAKLQARKEINT